MLSTVSSLLTMTSSVVFEELSDVVEECESEWLLFVEPMDVLSLEEADADDLAESVF